mgnify:CR=1 FL=1
MSIFYIKIQKINKKIGQLLSLSRLSHLLTLNPEIMVLAQKDPSLKSFLQEHCELRNDGHCWNKISNKKVVACMPMHTYGFPVKLDPIVKICQLYNIVLIEDAAESLGSLYSNKHTGNFGKISALSFNGNKPITCGAGGAIITNDKSKARRYHCRY